jgi:hypothetical protein
LEDILDIFDSLTLVFDKNDVENMDFSKIKIFIEEHNFNEILLYEASNRLDISFFGYEDDLREIYEIQEVRDWVKASMIDEQIPWFFFLSTSPASQSIKALAVCYCAEPIRQTNGTIKFQPMMQKMHEFAIINFSNMNDFIEEHNLTQSMNTQISNNVNAYLQNWIGGGK